MEKENVEIFEKRCKLVLPTWDNTQKDILFGMM
jgi:hypothetical protein